MIARSPDNIIAAEQLFSLYTEYIKSGFNKTQAMALIIVAIKAAIMAQAKHGRR